MNYYYQYTYTTQLDIKIITQISLSSVRRTVFSFFFDLKPTGYFFTSSKSQSFFMPQSSVCLIQMSPLISFFNVQFFSFRFLHWTSLWQTTVSMTSFASTSCRLIFYSSSSIHDLFTSISSALPYFSACFSSGCLLLRLPSSSAGASYSQSSSMRLSLKQSSSQGTSCHSDMFTVLSLVSIFSLQIYLRFYHSSFWCQLMMQPLGGSQYFAFVTLLMKQGSPVSSQMSILHIQNSSLSDPDSSPSFF